MSILTRIVVGVDGSVASREALRQATQLLEPDGSLLAVTVCDPSAAIVAAPGGGIAMEALERGAAEANAEADRELEGVANAETRIVRGSAAGLLLELAQEERATLVAVGSHDRSRAAGIFLGGVAATLLHEAPCAVLVARPAADPAIFPSSILAGVDGSPGSLAAFATAVELAGRFEAELRALAATGGKRVRLDVARLMRIARRDVLRATHARETDRVAARTLHAPLLEWSRRPPVEALVRASSGPDLLVLGSRALRGRAAIRSVSERVAHRARCSVLVQRSPSASNHLGDKGRRGCAHPLVGGRSPCRREVTEAGHAAHGA